MMVNERELVKKTKDCWYGNYKDNTVRLLYHGNVRRYDKTLKPIYKVSVWGNDDFGIEKEFNDENEAIKTFEILAKMDYINHNDLYKIGFTTY